MKENEVLKITVINEDGKMKCETKVNATPIDIIKACHLVKSNLKEVLENMYSSAPYDEVTRLLHAMFPIDEVV